MGLSWAKWDPEPGVGFDPQPILMTAPVPAWDDDKILFPVVHHDASLDHLSLLYTGEGTLCPGDQCVGGAHLPTTPGDAIRLPSLNPTFFHSQHADRWDSLLVYSSDWTEDAGVVTFPYSGGYEDLSVPGEQVVQIGTATNVTPTVTLSAPSDPHAMAPADPVTFTGVVTDTMSLDQLVILVTTDADPSVILVGAPDASGDFWVAAPGNTFPAVAQVVRVSVYDEGGLGASTSLVLDVQP
jgi:hypothetical protein